MSRSSIGGFGLTIAAAGVIIAAGSLHSNQEVRAQVRTDRRTTSQPASAPEATTDLLTKWERAWLCAHPVIRVAQDPGWPPVEFADERGEPSGMANDYLKLVEQRLGVTFERVRGLEWQEAYARLQRWDIDMTTSVAETPVRRDFWAFTQPYMKIPIVIVTRENVTYIANMRELAGRKVAVVDGYLASECIPRDFPGIQLVRVKTVREGLDRLQKEEVFAVVDNMLVISYYMAQLKLANLKIAGRTPYTNAQSMAVRKDWAILARIIQKALRSISEAERTAIYQKWVPIRYEHGFDYHRFWQVLAIFALILAGLSIWIRKLSREIRSRKAAEAALARYQDHLEELVDKRTRELEESRQRLQRSERLASVGTLAAGIAHEINNPLGMIVLGADTALGSLDKPEALGELLRRQKRDVERCARIVKGVLDFARQQPAEKRPLDLSDVVCLAMDFTREYARMHHVTVETLLADKPCPVLGNLTELEQVVVNLVYNAVQACADSGRVTIETDGADGTVRLVVRDDGCGMTPGQIEHAFDPFYTTRMDQGGTGLGLSTVHGIVVGHGGTIAIASEEGRGAAFTIEFPYHVEVETAHGPDTGG